MKTESTMTLDMAAHFCMTSREVLRHLSVCGAVPGVSREDGELVYTSHGLSEMMDRENMTCTRDGRTFTIRRFKGASCIESDEVHETFDTNTAADSFESMWRTRHGSVVQLKPRKEVAHD